jgi:hypothetical protein
VSTGTLLFRAHAPLHWGDEVHLSIAHRCPDGHLAVVEPLAFRTVDPGKVIEQPTIRMQREEAQKLIDELWRAGVRPTEGQGSVGQLAATNAHLADMRRLVFDPPMPKYIVTNADGVSL